MAELVQMPISDKPGANERFPMPDRFERQARANHGQTLVRLAQRGGLSWCEAAAIIEGRDWRAMDSAAAEEVVRKALAQPMGGEDGE